MIAKQQANHNFMGKLPGVIHGSVYHCDLASNKLLPQCGKRRNLALLIFCAVPASTVDTSTYPFPVSSAVRVGMNVEITASADFEGGIHLSSCLQQFHLGLWQPLQRPEDLPALLL